MNSFTEIVDIEVAVADDGQWYGRWVTETIDTEGHTSHATHFTDGFNTYAEAEAAIPA